MFKLTAVSALASVVCLSVGQHVFAADLDVVTDRNFFEGIFAGDVSPAEAPVDEYLRMYDGPLPAYRDPSYWGLFEYRARKGKPVSEKDVYHAFLRHYNETGNKDWEIGIGAGGQLYSWRGPWGEAIPPQNNLE